jgi:hypothetical protein
VLTTSHYLTQARIKLSNLIRGSDSDIYGQKLVSYPLDLSKNNNPNPHWELTITTITYNCGQYLKEWLDFHFSQGVEHVFVYDQQSTDNTLEILKPYIQSQLVTFIEWPSIFKNSTQIFCYAHSIASNRMKTKWMALIDTDEFIFSRVSANLLFELRKLDDFDALYLPWNCFGSSGHKVKPSGYVTRNYTHKAKLPTGIDWLDRDLQKIKAIIKPAKCKLVKVHGSEVSGSIAFNPENIQLNHYITRSEEEFNLKIKRNTTDDPWILGKELESWLKKRQTEFDYISKNYELDTSILKHEVFSFPRSIGD